MKRFIRQLAIVAAVFAPLMASMAPPANAASADTFVITGGGTISPGLTATGTPQAFNFSGDGTNVGTNGVAVGVHCDGTGNDAIGSIALGEGNETLTCTIGVKVIVIVCVWVRVGPFHKKTCVLVRTNPLLIMVWDPPCLFDPGQLTPPVTSYTLVCVAAVLSAP